MIWTSRKSFIRLCHATDPKRHIGLIRLRIFKMCWDQGCARLMSRESNLTRLWLKWVESELSRPWKSGIWVESESNHADRHLSQRWINWILLESKLSHWFFCRENVKILHLAVTLPGKKQPTTTFNPPPGQQILAKLGKMWWVVS